MEAIWKYVLMMAIIGWTSGISLYLTLAILGICGRMDLIMLPGSMAILEHPLVITAAIFMYLIEFFADKAPLIDSTWDSVHTFIRPTGAIAIAALAGTEHGVLAQTIVAILAGTIALNNHTIKTSSRLAINTSPEPFSNIAVSVIEDSAVFLMYYFYIKHPVIATVVLLVSLVGSFFILKALWRFVKKIFFAPKTAGETVNPSAPNIKE